MFWAHSGALGIRVLARRAVSRLTAAGLPAGQHRGCLRRQPGSAYAHGAGTWRCGMPASSNTGPGGDLGRRQIGASVRHSDGAHRAVIEPDALSLRIARRTAECAGPDLAAAAASRGGRAEP